MPWNTATDLQNWLKAAGMIALDPTAAELLLDYQGALDSAIDRWNDLTLFWPFLSTGADEMRAFVPEPLHCLMDLDGGLLSVTSLAIDVTYTDSVGAAYTEGQHFRLLPRDAPQKKKPYTTLEWLWTPRHVSDGEVRITGKWGFCLDANLPASAKRGVLLLAALELQPQILQGITGGLIRWTEGDRTKQFQALDDTMKAWQGLVESYALGFRRQRIA